MSELLENLKLSLKYSISLKHQKSLKERIKKIENKEKATVKAEKKEPLENQLMWDIGKKYVEKQEDNI